MGSARARRIGARTETLRDQFWPDLAESDLWHRKKHDGFITIPRCMPLILAIMDDLSKNKPVSSTYLELWGRTFDEMLVPLSKPDEMAFHAGFTGQRARRTWMQRLDRLNELGFISLKPGPNGPRSYALIYNPYAVIRRLHQKKMPGLLQDKYNALVERSIEIGEKTLLEPPAPVKAPDLDDEIPF